MRRRCRPTRRVRRCRRRRPPVDSRGRADVEVGAQGGLASVPALDRRVDDGAPCVPGGPRRASNVVEHGRSACRCAPDEPGLGSVGVEGLVAGVEPGADHDPGRAERHRPLAIDAGGDAAGGQDRDGCDGSDHRRQQVRQGRVVAAVPARLLALGDDDVSSGRGDTAGLRDGLHLAQRDSAGLMDHGDVRSRVAERQPHPAHASADQALDEARPKWERPRDQADADRGVGGDVELFVDPGHVAVATSDETEAACSCDGGCQRAAGDAGHRCVDDGGNVRHAVDSATRRRGRLRSPSWPAGPRR